MSLLAVVVTVIAIVGLGPSQAFGAGPSSVVGATVPWKIVDDTLVINCNDTSDGELTGTWNTSTAFKNTIRTAPWKGKAYSKVRFETLTRPRALSYLF